MKILILSIEYPPIGGGASPMIHQIAKQYVLMGHEVHGVTMAFGDLSEEEIMDGVRLFRIPCMRKSKHISYFWEHISFILAGRKFLRQHLQQYDFDVCHAHFIVPTGILARWVKRKFQIPYVITSQGSDVPGYNPDRFVWLHHFTPGLIRSIIDEASNIIAPSKYLQSLIYKVVGHPDEKIKQIPSGIDTHKYVPGPKKPILLSTGRLLPRKGFQYLVKAVHDEAFPFEVHICGDGPLMKELQSLAHNSKTPIIFHGWLDNESPAYIELLSHASYFCLVSAKENASTSLMEALAAGAAVITSNVSGCPESVGEAGICIPPGDVDALKKALHQLTSDDPYREGLMHNGRQRAIREFDWASIASRYIQLFSEIKGGHEPV